ncbi:hypothetical protein Salmuc_03273 [Salipiger mucosus DSM 16094]|uniref:Uncharacterized protein n=1 Tax=Salipiger mucosus DSM 16094 TaxID=1123237 RepID=S9Q991_9RHOB|nr:hypothetical protein Salmuc_03273 [Salipiger mucosus DSM 16094]
MVGYPVDHDDLLPTCDLDRDLAIGGFTLPDDRMNGHFLGACGYDPSGQGLVLVVHPAANIGIPQDVVQKDGICVLRRQWSECLDSFFFSTKMTRKSPLRHVGPGRLRMSDFG